MANFDLFETDKDNWLKKEIIRESRISVWDFDDRAKYLKDMHSENCDREKVYRKHQEKCELNRNSQNNYQRMKMKKDFVSSFKIISTIILVTLLLQFLLISIL